MNRDDIVVKRERERERETSGGDNRVDISMLRESVHAFLFSHVEEKAILYQKMHLHVPC